jgi:hypothetical protein
MMGAFTLKIHKLQKLIDKLKETGNLLVGMSQSIEIHLRAHHQLRTDPIFELGHTQRCGDIHPQLSKEGGMIRIRVLRQHNLRVHSAATPSVSTEITNSRGMSGRMNSATNGDKQ